MEMLPHIMTTFSTPWTAWMVFGMLLLLLTSEGLQPGYILECFHSAFTNRNRLFGDRSYTFGSSLCTGIYQVIVFAFVLYLCTTPPQVFSGTCLAQIILLFVGYLLVQKAGYWVVNYTFDLQRIFAPNLHLFASLRQALALALFPVSLLMIHVGGARWLQGIIIVLLGIYLLMLIIRTIRTFWDGIVSLPYILLYLFTLEILPLGLVILSAHYIC